jgi:hypothetical protein
MESINWIRSVDMVSSNGLQGIHIRGIIKMMKGMDMERCVGQMVVNILENG